MHQSVNKHISSLKNGKGGFAIVNESSDPSLNLNQQMLAGHRKGHMLDKLKEMKNLADQKTMQQLLAS